MNLKQLANMQHSRVKLRPRARRFEKDGSELPSIDDLWIIQETSRDRITVLNTRTEHLIPIGTDHIREYLTDSSGQSDGFLKLKSEIVIQGKAASVEPLDDRGRSFRPWSANVLDEVDDALRVAAGIVIQGPTPLSESSTGRFSTITISSFVAYFRFERFFVAYNGGSISGLARETTYYVYFDDPNRRGGPVPYIPTPVRYEALSEGRLYLGRLRTRPSS